MQTDNLLFSCDDQNNSLEYKRNLFQSIICCFLFSADNSVQQNAMCILAYTAPTHFHLHKSVPLCKRFWHPCCTVLVILVSINNHKACRWGCWFYTDGYFTLQYYNTKCCSMGTCSIGEWKRSVVSGCGWSYNTAVWIRQSYHSHYLRITTLDFQNVSVLLYFGWKQWGTVGGVVISCVFHILSKLFAYVQKSY